MVAIRCTARLLARVGLPQEVSGPTTTVLGDWYATHLGVRRQRFVLLISEHSRLPVLMAGRDLKHLAENFPNALAPVLWGLGIDAVLVNREVEATRGAVIAKTNSRSHLGTLTDFANLLGWQLQGQADPDLVQAAVELAHTPMAASTRQAFFPDQLTRRLLEG